MFLVKTTAETLAKAHSNFGKYQMAKWVWKTYANCDDVLLPQLNFFSFSQNLFRSSYLTSNNEKKQGKNFGNQLFFTYLASHIKNKRAVLFKW